MNEDFMMQNQVPIALPIYTRTYMHGIPIQDIVMHGMARTIWLSTRIYGIICIRVVYSYASTVYGTPARPLLLL